MKEMSPVVVRFILHWGEMGTRWGVNRTVAQIHALLFLSERPLHAEEISKALSVARSNVSTSLRELQGWGLVKVVHLLGDRRDHFEAKQDVWEAFRLILDERKKREVDPTLEVLQSCMADLDKAKQDDPVTRRRLGDMLEFFESMTSFYQQFQDLPAGAARRFFKSRSKLRSLFLSVLRSD